MRAQSHDRRDKGTTVAEAARVLGITEAAVRKRVERGKLAAEHRRDGRLLVYLDRDTTAIDATHYRPRQSRGASEADERYTRSLEEQVEYLRSQLDQERTSSAEFRRIVAGLTQRIPEIEARQDVHPVPGVISNTAQRRVPESAEEELVAENYGDLRLSLANFLPAPKPRLSWTYYVFAIFLSAALWVWGASTLPGLPLLTLAPLLFGFWIGLRRPSSSKGAYAVSTLAVGVLVPVLMLAIISLITFIKSILPVGALDWPFELIPLGWPYYFSYLLDPIVMLLLFAYLVSPTLLFLSGSVLGELTKRWRNSQRRAAWRRTGEPIGAAPADVDPDRPDPTVIAAYWAFGGAILAGFISATATVLGALVQRGGS